MSHYDSLQRASWDADDRSSAENIVVVGGGPAAHRCLIGLRKAGYTGSLTVVSSDTLLPYDRTLLSKGALMNDAAGVVSMALPGQYESLDIQVRLGRTAVELNEKRQVIELADGTALDYDRAVLAVGGSPILPRALAAPGVLTIRRATDVAPMRDALERSRYVVVIGAGFIGGEIAAAARTRGCAVTLVESASTPLEGVLGAEVGTLLGDQHVSHGVDVRCGVQADSVHEVSEGYLVVLSDGTTLACDSVVVGVGMRPAIDWLRSTGIEIDRAILTDSMCRTSIPGVFAAGDCAQWWSPRYGCYCHVEHWDTAGKHGAAAAQAIMGRADAFDPLPFFWSDQYDIKYQWAGYAPTWDAVDLVRSESGAFCARYLYRGASVGVFTANDPHEFGRLRRELLNATTTTANAEMMVAKL